MSKKRILLVGGNFYPETTGIGKYNGEMIDWLAAKGFECTVITTYPYYPHWQVQHPYHKRWFWYKTEIKEAVTEGGNHIKIYRCPHYVPKTPSGLKRIMLDFSFSMSCFVKILQLIPAKKFDVVITVVPPFHLGLLAVLYKKIRKAKFFYHIQDLQIEAARDLQMIKSEKVIKTLFGLEKYIIQHADTVSSISDGMIEKIKAKAGKEVTFFPNWVDVNVFHPLNDKEQLKEEFGFAPTDKIVLYSGAIGEKQGLEAIIHTADKLREKKDIKFLICGSGPYKEKLKAIAEALKLGNVVFYPLQPFEKFNKFLNMADLHLVIQKAKASDLVMPSKLTTILAVGGVAVITANPGSSLYDLVKKYGIGILVEAENQDSLTKGIENAIMSSNLDVATHARAYAENNLSIDNVLSRYIGDV
ncbi:colanic acid biosynthesis glycosyl transferase WcaI [Filimonas lacunae]|uniref:Colanic acid biosynthesis glycosyl transferase WcaI n=1 Tax=Filimonas lacunae TaxID=477680 RepID=A0A173M9T6_9BACT|nr:WcaI family glycosyltransferase [Filimonas lacunae]BAV04295.1 glycosyl transferase, group 1 family protein [Filimonas lacunae]SIT30939.1 colanic acid biosynthesis glycosyl transferase WcaI [Filimonas lacunae]